MMNNISSLLTAFFIVAVIVIFLQGYWEAKDRLRANKLASVTWKDNPGWLRTTQIVLIILVIVLFLCQHLM